MAITVKQISALSSVSREQWQQLNTGGNPFLHYDFLNGLEKHNCLKGHGWEPFHIIVCDQGALLGALPLYIKDNSYGEFVFDWLWADAYERAGGRYYPKLVSAIPFTPVCGPRILTSCADEQVAQIKALIVRAVKDLIEKNRISSFHCLFTEADDQKILKQHDLLLRKTCQFHWHNRDYEDFDDFIAGMTSKRRKQIRRERKKVSEDDIDIARIKGGDITEEQWGHFYEFYCSTFYKRWGNPRLTLDFFHSLSNNLPDSTLLILAKENSQYIAGAFAMIGSTTLYGRHWGCRRHLSNLHFELCYYQTIEYCIENRLKCIDAGVQGEHKISRGFDPVLTMSGHWIAEPGFRDAISEYLQRESADIDAYIATLQKHSPYKTGDTPS